ncbi:MAG: hypothetical protein KDD15_21265, partial [Lewinella sp.]|nr:hypothetical protein [Lewinella sp.]
MIIVKKSLLGFKCLIRCAFLMLLCLLASPDALMAQGKTVPNTVRDTIYHRNGWVYHGQITKYTEGEMVRLRDPSGAP